MTYENKDVPKIKKKTQKDSDEFGTKYLCWNNWRPRFGYFSIAYGSHVGDQFYSMAKKPVLDENKHVLTEKRNMYPSPVKQGKGPDVYFQNMVEEDKETQKRVKELAEKDKEEYKEKVKGRKKGAQTEYKQSFKPTGPQEYQEM